MIKTETEQEKISKKLTAVGLRLEEVSKKLAGFQRQTATSRGESTSDFYEKRSASFRTAAKEGLTNALFGSVIGGLLNKKREIKERKAFELSQQQEFSADNVTAEKIEEPTNEQPKEQEVLKERMEQFMDAITKSMNSVNERVGDVDATTKKISGIVTAIQQRVSPRDVQLKPKEEGQDPTTIRYDPLAPTGKQFSKVSKSGKAMQYASKEDTSAATFTLGRRMPNEDQTNLQGTSDEYSQETKQEATATQIDIAKEDPVAERLGKVEEKVDEILEKMDKGSFFKTLLMALPALLGAAITKILDSLPTLVAIGKGIAKVVGWIGKKFWGVLETSIGFIKRVLKKVATVLGFGDDVAETAAKAGAKAGAKVGAEVAETAAEKGAAKVGAEVAETAAEKGAAKVGAEVAETAAEKGAAKVGAEVGEAAVEDAAKSAAKTVGKDVGKEVVEKTVKTGVAKMLAKKIPFIGAAVGLGFGAWRLLTEGDITGASLEAASGLTSLVPGPGTAAGLAIDAGLIARDISRDLGIPPEEALKMVKDEINKQLGNVEKVNDKIETKTDQVAPKEATEVPPNAKTNIRQPTTDNSTLVPQDKSAVGDELDVRSSDLAQRRTVPTTMQPIVINQKAAAPQQMKQQKEGPGTLVIKTRHMEPSLATYRASVFDHPVTHPGNYLI